MDRKVQRYRNGELVVVVDCSDLEQAAGFWGAVLGFAASRPNTGPYRSLLPADGDGVEVLLQRVGEGKKQKNRLHLDLRTADLDAEVSRVLRLGATMVSGAPIVEGGWRWHILADPDGNEFCVLQPPDGDGL